LSERFLGADGPAIDIPGSDPLATVQRAARQANAAAAAAVVGRFVAAVREART